METRSVAAPGRSITGARASGAASSVPIADFRAALDESLAELDADGVVGPALRATGLRMRLRVPDLGLSLAIAASDDPAHHLEWSFDSDLGNDPGVDLVMDSGTANRYLQGALSLAIGLARGRISCRGDTRRTLHSIPAVRLIAQRYRRLVRDRYPSLAVD
jgi:hypothetical protein